ncbi:MAG: hypothetical protein J5879_04640 [Clostridia bacterium]|nr:hypothetical protein [Clostridia bacterium]
MNDQKTEVKIKGNGVTSTPVLVFGIISAACLIFDGGILSVAGIVLGILAIVFAKKYGEENGGLDDKATIGKILGIVGLSVGGALMLIRLLSAFISMLIMVVVMIFYAVVMLTTLGAAGPGIPVTVPSTFIG